MSNDMSYHYRKEESKKNGSYYMKHGGKREKPQISPYEYGAILEKKRRRK